MPLLCGHFFSSSIFQINWFWFPFQNTTNPYPNCGISPKICVLSINRLETFHSKYDVKWVFVWEIRLYIIFIVLSMFSGLFYWYIHNVCVICYSVGVYKMLKPQIYSDTPSVEANYELLNISNSNKKREIFYHNIKYTWIGPVNIEHDQQQQQQKMKIKQCYDRIKHTCTHTHINHLLVKYLSFSIRVMNNYKSFRIEY